MASRERRSLEDAFLLEHRSRRVAAGPALEDRPQARVYTRDTSIERLESSGFLTENIPSTQKITIRPSATVADPLQSTKSVTKHLSLEADGGV